MGERSRQRSAGTRLVYLSIFAVRDPIAMLRRRYSASYTSPATRFPSTLLSLASFQAMATLAYIYGSQWHFCQCPPGWCGLSRIAPNRCTASPPPPATTHRCSRPMPSLWNRSKTSFGGSSRHRCFCPLCLRSVPAGEKVCLAHPGTRHG